MFQKLKKFFVILWSSFIEAQEARAKDFVRRNRHYL